MSNDQDDVYATIARLRERHARFCVATIVRTQDATSAKAGAKAIVDEDGEITGFLGGGCVQGAVKRTAKAVMEEGRARLVRVRPTDQVVTRLDVDGVELHKSGCPSGGTVDLFVEPMLPPPNLVVCGASPVATALARLASGFDYRVCVAALEDDQPRFDAADRRVTGFDFTELDIAPADYVVVATQGKRDKEALGAALRSPATYVAMVGSRRKAATLTTRLVDEGLAPEWAARLRSPAGLDVGAIGPDEIALSILAEIVGVRRADAREEASGEAAGADDADARPDEALNGG